MRIARHIANLLFDYECVVIPGFGGFITKTHAAEIHPIKHQFKPPYKEIVFNPHLRTNDGLLLNHIARSEELSYQDAKRRLDRFVLKCLRELGNGRRIGFRKIGVLYYDNEKQIVFEADTSQNYLASSFGLTGFVSPAIKREGFRERIESTIKEKQTAKKTEAAPPPKMAAPPKQRQQKKKTRPEQRIKASTRRSPLHRQLAFIGILLFMLSMAWAVMNQQTVSQYYNTYAGYVPFFYSSPNEYLAKNMDALPVERLLRINKADQTPAAVEPNRAKNDLGAVKKIESQPEPNYDYTYEANETAQQIESPDLAFVPEAISPATPAPKVETPPAQAIEQSHNLSPGRYHIVAGAFREKENADKLIAQLRQRGFNAQYAGQSSGGLWRVSYESSDDHQVAASRLNTIKNEENPNAWLLSLN